MAIFFWSPKDQSVVIILNFLLIWWWCAGAGQQAWVRSRRQCLEQGSGLSWATEHAPGPRQVLSTSMLLCSLLCQMTITIHQGLHVDALNILNRLLLQASYAVIPISNL
jgi:hypothetical protein